MAGIKLFLIATAAVVLAACAEVLPLTGGDEDTTAPRVKDRIPEQGALYYKGNSVEITFDEYIRLNDPANTITLNPSAGKLTTELRNRTVKVAWSEPLAENTTYILQLNGTVRDLNEGNDSIMQFVFSTGSSIDSLMLQGRTFISYNNQVAAQMTVGLYAPTADPFTEMPRYATRSDARGQFRFDYLKPGDYRLFAFMDKNRDRLPQPAELIGFWDETVNPSDTVIRELPVFSPEPDRKTVKADFLKPGLLRIYNRDSLNPDRLFINGERTSVVRRFTADSLLVLLPESELSSNVIVYGQDTLQKIIPLQERKAPLKITALRNLSRWQQGDSLQFSVDDAISEVRSENIRIVSEKGNEVKYEIVRPPDTDCFTLIPEKSTTESFTVRFAPGAVSGRSAESDSVSLKVALRLPADLSNLHLNLSDFEGDWIIELVQNEKTMYGQLKPEGINTVDFQNLEPGEYGVRCIRDENGNGKWDTGDYRRHRQPEKVLRYTLTQKLRANWDVEETLEMRP